MSDDSGSASALDKNRTDCLAVAARAVLGAAPFAGSLLIELSDVIIPNQRMERVVGFVKVLDERLKALEQDRVREELRNEHFTDLLENGVRQSAQSVSSQRREHIADLIANSLSSEDIEYQESRHLLRILGELNDSEIIWLQFLSLFETGRDAALEFRQKHEDVLRPIARSHGSSRRQLDKGALQDSYKAHLAQLGLLETTPNRSGHLDFKMSSLGRLLLREIGLADSIT